ncbi:MAG: polysaccharide biosynthesis/export family protein [Pseudomonadota bacterium]
MLRKTLLLALGVLAGCGVVYFPPGVKDQVGSSDTQVETVVEQLTPALVASLNKSAYVPVPVPDFLKDLPGVPAVRASAPRLDEPIGDQSLPRNVPDTLPRGMTPTPYRIGPGDTLAIFAEGLFPRTGPSLFSGSQQNNGSDTAPRAFATQRVVQESGSVNFPRLGRVPVGGLTLQQAENQVLDAFLDQQLNPEFAIEITDFGSQSVIVGGVVANPSSLPISRKPLFISSAIQAAGGIDPQVGTADTARENLVVQLLRDDKIFSAAYKDILARSGSERVLLQDGDVVLVSNTFDVALAQSVLDQKIAVGRANRETRQAQLDEIQLRFNIRRDQSQQARQNFESMLALESVERHFVYLAGEVEQNARFPLPFGRTASLADALYQSSGPVKLRSDPRRIYLLRADERFERVTAFQLDARNVSNLVLATRLELRPNDIVFVAAQPVSNWNTVVSQLLPTITLASQVQ